MDCTNHEDNKKGERGEKERNLKAYN